MRSRALLLFLWAQVALAACTLAFWFYSQYARPTIQIDYSRTTGVVTGVFPGGAAERAGVREGDRILLINGAPVRPSSIPLYFAKAGKALPVVLDRDGELIEVDVVPVTLEASRRQSLFGEPHHLLWAVVGYMSIPLHVWMFGLGIALLFLRPDNADARISALVFVYWSGGLFLFEAPGTGALLQAVPVGLRAAFYSVDALFIALFFAACLHFAIVFPGDASASPRRRWFVLLAYAAVIPIFVEELLEAWGRVDPASPVIVSGRSNIYTFLGPTLLIASLAILGMRLRRTTRRNARRRMQLVFVALLPGVAGFVISVILSRAGAGPAWLQFGRLLNTIGVIAGSVIYVYAVVRHRMYDIRVLVRRSIQYALARGTLLFVMTLPAVALVVYLWAHRSESLASLITGQPGIYLALLVPLVLVLAMRRRLLDELDKRFFRQQYDARTHLLKVVSVVREGSDVFGVSRVALDEVRTALHPKHISLWQLDGSESVFVRGLHAGDSPARVESLAVSGALPALLASSDDPLDRYSRQNRSLVERLPQGERAWLDSVDAYLIVPMVIQQRLVGMMILGERKSEEPYSTDDRDLLRSIAAQLALTYDYSRLKGSPSLVWSQTPPLSLISSDALHVCPTCGRCFPPGTSHCDNDKSPLSPEQGIPREIEGKYVITRLLGRGGMGSVFMAMQTRLNRPVAVKVLLAHLVGSSSMRSRFEREARIVARLRHPSIVTVHDFGVLASGHAYLVMEYLDGMTLRKAINSGPMKVDEAIRILELVGGAVDSAHRAGVVHRDLKPENVVLVPDADEPRFVPRVLDFGLAKMTTVAGDDDATLVQSAKSFGVVGTLMYMAPEVLGGRPADARSDQYSLALVAYEVLCGKHPFHDANDLAAIVRSHSELEPPMLHARSTSAPSNVCDAIHRALAKSPDDRFPSVAAFVAALRG